MSKGSVRCAVSRQEGRFELYSQWNEMAATTRPIIIPGAENIMILRRPMMSMYFNAKSVKTKFVPETIKLTAMESLKPISSKRVAMARCQAICHSVHVQEQHTAIIHELPCGYGKRRV